MTLEDVIELHYHSRPSEEANLRLGQWAGSKDPYFLKAEDKRTYPMWEMSHIDALEAIVQWQKDHCYDQPVEGVESRYV